MWCLNSLLRRCAAPLLALSTAALLPLAAWAEDDPPGRVGRVADLQGSVSYYEGEQGQWTEASRNRPLTTGDRLSTDGDARAELRIGSTTVRLGPGSELELARVDDERVTLQLHSGQLAVRIRDREVANETVILTDEARLLPMRSGHYRIDRIDDTTYAGAWRGELRVDDDSGDFTIAQGRRAELWREGRRDENNARLRREWDTLTDDEFGDWVARQDRGDERSASNRYVSPEMTGAEELDRHGRWERHPEYGTVWVPVSVQADWAPYRYGRWAWIRPWGWTWVDDAPWGFAPFHYGRWVFWGNRWAWYPGTYVRRPVYAPALVAWIGAPGVGISINIGGPSVGWVPLAPREVYVPWYRYSPRYAERVNHRPPGSGWQIPVPREPIMYGNQGVPNGVTVVPRDALARREPVSRVAIDVRGSLPQRAPVTTIAAPEGPGGAQPAPRRPAVSDDGRPAPPRRVVQPVAPLRSERQVERQQLRQDGRQESRQENRQETRQENRQDSRQENRQENRPTTRPDERRPVQPVPPAQPAPQRERPAAVPAPAPAPVQRPSLPERTPVQREAPREVTREAPREVQRPALREVQREAPREVQRPAPREVERESPRENRGNQREQRER